MCNPKSLQSLFDMSLFPNLTLLMPEKNCQFGMELPVQDVACHLSLWVFFVSLLKETKADFASCLVELHSDWPLLLVFQSKSIGHLGSKLTENITFSIRLSELISAIVRQCVLITLPVMEMTAIGSIWKCFIWDVIIKIQNSQCLLLYRQGSFISFLI